MRKTVAMASIAFGLLLSSFHAFAEQSWPMYGRNLRHTFTNEHSPINPSTVYSLDARDGSLLWKRVICGNPEEQNCASDANDRTRIFSSPAVFDGLIFLGHTVEVNGYRGGFEALDARTGQIVWRFEVDPIVHQQAELISDARGRQNGGQNRGG